MKNIFDTSYYLEATLYLKYFGDLGRMGCDILGELDFIIPQILYHLFSTPELQHGQDS